LDLFTIDSISVMSQIFEIFQKELASIKQHGNSLLLSKNTEITRKIEKTVAPGEITVQNKHDLIQHAAQE